ncbi:MAG TPA: hypothetical protein VMV27_14035 [Candidatus Binataceae bacterium]|nr:hypothetical protein [Candidatus Binataceae bacterium]
MNWDAVAALVTAGLTLAGLNLGALRWLLERHQQAVLRDSSRWAEIERGLYELRASLPLEYVRREDWIRFGATLDAKLDAMREEMRQEIATLKERLYG